MGYCTTESKYKSSMKPSQQGSVRFLGDRDENVFNVFLLRRGPLLNTIGPDRVMRVARVGMKLYSLGVGRQRNKSSKEDVRAVEATRGQIVIRFAVAKILKGGIYSCKCACFRLSLIDTPRREKNGCYNDVIYQHRYSVNE